MSQTSEQITVIDRPFLMTFPASGNTYPVSADEVRRLVAEYPLMRFRSHQITLRADDGQHVRIFAATIGGGPAFEREEIEV